MQTNSSTIKKNFYDFYIENNTIESIQDSIVIAAAGLGLAAIGSPFVESNKRGNLINGTILFTCLTIIGNEYVKRLKSRDNKLVFKNKTGEKADHLIKQKMNFLPSLAFSTIDMSTRVALFHEMGHALAAKILYEFSKPRIILEPYLGGCCISSIKNLSNIGKIFGRNGSLVLLTAGGPFAQTLLATSDLGVSHLLKERSPKLSRYLACSAIMNIAGACLYALKGIAPLDKQNDYYILWKKGGIHPLVSCGLLVGVPYVAHLFFSYLSKKEKATSPEEQL